MAAPREVTPIIRFLRDFFLQRKFNTSLRYQGINFSPRDQRAPNLPEGVSHNLSSNYYFTRDGRRSCRTPTTAYDAEQKQIAPGEGSDVPVAESGPKLPGHGHDGGQIY